MSHVRWWGKIRGNSNRVSNFTHCSQELLWQKTRNQFRDSNKALCTKRLEIWSMTLKCIYSMNNAIHEILRKKILHAGWYGSKTLRLYLMGTQFASQLHYCHLKCSWFSSVLPETVPLNTLPNSPLFSTQSVFPWKVSTSFVKWPLGHAVYKVQVRVAHGEQHSFYSERMKCWLC